ncbi:hypothetical protein GCM10025868_22720 [Angustibacter aerolatus]|uniref:Uncharacterized protein n=1 Tax=Angustibacter aerolatus TaxID=1162965 RepID=A0ABQ6JGZ5_9ACTN|nr:hypothetical protein GCM10025868_22720 [Angustibacter aerolatus]
MPRTIGGNSGFVRSGITTPTVVERAVFRLRAIGFGWYPSVSAAFSTRFAVSEFTSRRVDGFSAREAVAAWTPARLRDVPERRRLHPAESRARWVRAAPSRADPGWRAAPAAR